MTFADLRTTRLRLRAPRESDAAAIFASFATDPEVTRFLTWRPHRRLAEAEEALAARLARHRQGTEYSWILEPTGSEGLVGIVSAWAEPGGAELGFVLARPSWGQGLATEPVLAVRRWADGAPGLARLWATCDLDNRASARVLEKAGFTDRGVFHREIVRPNLGPEPRPSLLFETLLSAG